MQLALLSAKKDWNTLLHELQNFDSKKLSPEVIKFISDSLALPVEKSFIIRQMAKIIGQNSKSFNSATLQQCIVWCLNLKDLNIDQAKAFIAMLKTISILLQEFKIETPENFIKFVFKCSFVGIPLFTKMNIESNSNTDLSSDSDSSLSNDIVQKAFGKIRSGCVSVLKVLIKEFPLYFQNNWSMLLRTKNYQEQSLLSLLVHEPRRNVKMNIVATITNLLEILNVGKWIQGHDFTKLQQQQGFQPKAYQLFQAVKSIHETNLYLLQGWKKLDYQLNACLLKLEYNLIVNCYILTKLSEEEGVYPLYQLYLQMFPVSEGINMKIAILQIVNALFAEGSTISDVALMENTFKQIVINALQVIQENLDTTDNILFLYVTECFNILQKVQRHFHKQFIQFVPNVWDVLQQIKKKSTEIRQLQQYYRIFEAMSEIMNPDQTLNVILPEIILETLKLSVEIVPSGLNIIGNLNDEFWQQQEEAVIYKINQSLTELHRNIFSEGSYNTSSLKISFYKGIGSYCNCPTLLKYDFVNQSVQQMFDKLQGHNIHVLEKSSWAAANLSSLIPLNEQFYEVFLQFANNVKEKISTNGLRGLGYFLMKQEKELGAKNLVDCYRKALLNKNPKISWNASTSLHKAIKNQVYSYLIMECKDCVLNILFKHDNLKVQMHCIELVTSIKDTEWGRSALKAMVLLLSHFSDHNNFIEKKYQTRMRESIFDAIDHFFSQIPMPLLIETLEQTLHDESVLEKIVQEIYIQLLQKKPQESEIIFVRSDRTREEIMSLDGFKDDEQTFRAQHEQNYPIQKYLKVKPNQEFNKCFDQLSKIAKMIHTIIDDSQMEKMVSFNALDALSELGSDFELIKLYD